MAVTATPLNAAPDEYDEFKACVRMLLRDYASNNIVLDTVQFTDTEFDRCVRMAVSEFNSTSPQTSMEWRQIPEHILFLGTARYLMLSESFLQIRNQVSVQTDGLGAVGLDDKYALYSQCERSLNGEFKSLVRQYKNELNMRAAFGGLSSGYLYVSRFQQG
jgi:hypothetical protein